MRKNREFTPTQIIVLGFLVTILIGQLLLMLDISNKKPIDPIDALFVATTSVCVTGLTTVDISSQFTTFGHIIILLLIQIGGLGIITFMTFFLILFKRKLTLRNRLLIKEAYSSYTFSGIGNLAKRILYGTLIVEGIGALIYSTVFIPEFGLIKGIWYSIFHAVSAFCNAGIDIIGDSSLKRYVFNNIININTMILVMLAGIGFPVWWDIIDNIKYIKNGFLKKISKYTKLSLILYFGLFLIGTLLIFFLELNNDDTIGKMTLKNQIMASAFQSVTLRTCGFVTIPQEALTVPTVINSSILMFIGGSAQGTAGGVKTVTMFIVILSVISNIKGKKNVEIMKRNVEKDLVVKASSIVLFNSFILIIALFLLSITENASLSDLLFEVVSALNTVGLTRDLTSNLSFFGKVIIISTMFLGRIGPITIALVWNVKGSDKIKLPNGKFLLG